MKRTDSKSGQSLSRSLGLVSVTLYGVGLTLGAGIYSIIGAAAGEAGESLWASFALAAFVATLTSLSYAELATMYPKAGAEYTYMSEAAPQTGWARRILGILMVFAGTATASTVAVAFAEYMRVFIEWPLLLLTAALLFLMASLNVLGVKHSTWANGVMTVIEAAGLVLVIVAGMNDPEFGKGMLEAIDTGVLAGAGLVFFSYLGFEDIVNMAEETKEPERTIPRAILISLGVSACLYILVAISVVALAPPEDLAKSGSPLAHAIGERWPNMVGVMGGIALFATANTALIAMVAASRMTMGMARARDLPKALAQILPRRKTPWIAAIAVLAVSLALLPLKDAAVLGGISSFATLLAFACVNYALIALRYRKPSTKRPFRVPFSVGKLPVIPAVGILCALALAFSLPPIAYISGGTALLALALIEVVRAKRGRG